VKGDSSAWTVPGKTDQGLFEATKVESDRNVFRVSMLRNVAKTSPYFHDGGVLELKKAVQIMAEIQLGERLLDKDADALVSFLEALTGEIPVNYRSPSSKESKKDTQ
jgi:cytochrome c peroxidase